MSAEPVEAAVPPVLESHGDLSRPLTCHDLQTIPGDHYRYELLDGVLLASPAPGSAPLLAVTGLSRLLDAAASDDQLVGVAPYDSTWRETTSLEPDVFVVRLADLGERRSTVPPLLTGTDELTVAQPFPVTLTCALFDR